MKVKSKVIFAFTVLCSVLVFLSFTAPIFGTLSYGGGFTATARYITNSLLTDLPYLLLPVCAVLGFFLERQKRAFKILSAVLALFMLSEAYSYMTISWPKYLVGAVYQRIEYIRSALFCLLIAASAILQLFSPKFKKTKLIVFFAALLMNIAAALFIIFYYKTGLQSIIILLSQTFLMLPAFYDGFSLRTEKITPCV